MRFLFLFIPILCIGQRIEYYHYGYGGIEKGLIKKDSTIIFCDSLARPQIMFEVMDSLIAKYRRNEIIPGILNIEIKSAKILGLIRIRIKQKLKVIIYTYNKIIYSSGLIEIYVEPKKKK